MDTKLKSIKKEKKQGLEEKTKIRAAKYAPVMISEQGGIRYLHFGSVWIQGAMNIRKPDWIALEYGRQMMAWMLFISDPGHIVQLGLGTGALTKFCYRHFPKAKITAIELNQEVISVCRSMFALPQNDERLMVLEMNAMDYVLDENNTGAVHVLHVDLYDATAYGPVLDSPEFYAACQRCLKPDGIMTVNLFGDHQSYGANLRAIRQSFEKVISLSPTNEGNVVVIAFKNQPDIDLNVLSERAKNIKSATGLSSQKWMKDFKKALSD